MKRVLLAGPLLMLVVTGACVHTHAQVRTPARATCHHHHRLDCDHLVSCRPRRGHHHHATHRSHERYVHLHATRGNRYARCTVTRGRHAH